MKKKIAVFFGGRSPEHDVSIVTGLQVLEAVDQTRYEAFPVYISPAGDWLVGEALRRRDSYMIDGATRKTLTHVTLDVNLPPAGRKAGRLVALSGGLLGRGKVAADFDAALLAFHGLFGEDGGIQGLLDLAGVPYTGLRTMGTSVLMDKVATKKILQALDIPVLPYAVLKRPDEGYRIPEDEIADILRAAAIDFPCILKPSHLGSSIGIAKVTNIQEVIACLPAVFEFDDTAILEPFVSPLVEYNVAVARIGGAVRTSAIERPKTSAELLDFKEKYMAGGSKGGVKGGVKTAGQSSQGMLSLTRELNPALPKDKEADIRRWAERMFEGISGTGAPRIDFISNGATGEIWLNEVNPIPGSFGYFLWEAAAEPVLFTELVNTMLDEAFAERRKRSIPRDAVPLGARLFKRPV